MKKYLLAILTILFIIGVAYFIFKFYSGTKSVPASSTTEQTNTVTIPQNTTTAVSSKTWMVEYKENIFIPKELKIKKGDTVTWTNRDSQAAWPASGPHPMHSGYSGFDALRGLSASESYSFIFNKVGSWKYHNHLNPSATGIIIVSE